MFMIYLYWFCLVGFVKEHFPLLAATLIGSLVAGFTSNVFFGLMISGLLYIGLAWVFTRRGWIYRP